MNGHKIKIRIGSHEMEAEGASKEEIDERLSLFKELVLGTRSATETVRKPSTVHVGKSDTSEAPNPASDNPLTAIFKVDGKTVSLTTPPQGQNREGDAFLLLLLGQRLLRTSDWVLVGDIKAGLVDSGFPVDRVDTITATIPADLYMKRGQRMGKQFRLTNPGTQRAEALAGEILASIS